MVVGGAVDGLWETQESGSGLRGLQLQLRTLALNEEGTWCPICGTPCGDCGAMALNTPPNHQHHLCNPHLSSGAATVTHMSQFKSHPDQCIWWLCTCSLLFSRLYWSLFFVFQFFSFSTIPRCDIHIRLCINPG